MNIHPLFVHFPIAFFVTYSVFELLRFKKLKKIPYWFNLKATLVILGVIAALAAGITGNIAEKQFADNKDLISLHSHIMFAASLIFSIAAAAYFISLLKNTKINFSKIRNLWNLALKYESLVLETPLVMVLALLGLIVISIGGALGGAIVYGQNFDPFTSFIYSLFFH